jgi:RNA-directed DNA polymerase
MAVLEQVIRAEALKLIRRHEQYARWAAEESVRRQRRVITRLARLDVRRPRYWNWAPGFDPYIVRSRATAIAHSIDHTLKSRSYHPRSPAGYEVPKAGGGRRVVSVFQVADNAVSSIVFKSLMEKNRGKMSGRAYAYRPDLTAHDALQFIQSEFARSKRLFIAEYDFSKYFDSIDQDYIWKTLIDGKYLMTRSERQVISAFLSASLPTTDGSAYHEFGDQPRDRGIPQGTSISLFLANLAAAPLDRELERHGVGFVRYADDTLLWSTDYGTLGQAVDVLHRIASDIGADINQTKSDGISLLVPKTANAEFRHKHYVEFVGHQVGLSELNMKPDAAERIKARLRELMYTNLLMAVHDRTIDGSRLSGKVDRDYVVFIWQARRFLYGDLSEQDLRRFKSRGTPMRRFKGVMSYYPLVDDSEALQRLDQWFSAEVWLTMRRRERLLKVAGFVALPPPLGLDRMALVSYRRKSATTGGVLDLRLPSFRRIASVIRAAAIAHGPNRIGKSPSAYEY